MNWQKEVKCWISKLQQELDGLNVYFNRITSPASSPKAIPEKVRKVVHIFREGLLNLIDKSNSLLKFSTEPGEKLMRLREEYQKAIKSLEGFYNSTKQKNSKNHYNFSTFTSRVRSQSRNELKPSKEKTARNRSSTPKQVQFQESYKPDLTFAKKKLKELREELKAHEHLEYQRKINELELDNEEIRKMIEEATEDAKENLACLEELKNRIEKLENKKNSSESSTKRPRYLLKTPSQTSDSLLRDFD